MREQFVSKVTAENPAGLSAIDSGPEMPSGSKKKRTREVDTAGGLHANEEFLQRIRGPRRPPTRSAEKKPAATPAATTENVFIARVKSIVSGDAPDVCHNEAVASWDDTNSGGATTRRCALCACAEVHVSDAAFFCVSFAPISQQELS